QLLVLWESANEDYERKGYEVIRESPTILGVSVGNEEPRMNGLAIAARNFGFLSILFSPCAIVALICGYMALAQIRERGERGRSEAMTGITIGWTLISIFSL